MKRILHISKYYYPFRGGIEQTARDCVEALKGKYNQKVICFNHEKGDTVNEIDDIEVIRCGTYAKISSQSLSISYRKLIKSVIHNFNPDIIIFHYPNPFVARYLLRYIPKSCKLVIYWHLDIVKQRILGKLFVVQNEKLLKRANSILATSPIYIEGSPYLSRYKEKCKVIPSCINVERLQMNEEAEKLALEIRENYKEKIIGLAVGRYTQYKGFEYLIKASHKLDDRFEIFIVGKGEETQKLKLEAGKDKKIHFLGLISDVELKAYYKAMDIFCFPSITKNEAFGLALAEGMYFEKPAVTFTIPGSGVNYVCLNGEDGIEVPNKDVDAYAKALTILANKPELRRQLGINAKKRVTENFLNKQFIENIRKAIESLD